MCPIIENGLTAFGSLINTNMHVEAMHKVLKYIYADRKTVRRR